MKHPVPSMSRSLGDAWRGLWRHARGRRDTLSGALLLLVGAELLRLPLPWLAGEAVNVLQRDGVAGAAIAARWLAWLFAIVVAAWLCHGAGRVLERNVALHARRSLALELMQQLLRAPLRWHRREHPLAVAQRAMQGTAALTDFAESQYIYLQTAVQIAGPVIALALISPTVGAAAFVGFALLAGTSLGFDRVLLRVSDDKNEAERRNGATWGELLGQMATLIALRMERGALALVGRRLAAVLLPMRRLVLINELKWGAIDIFGHLLWCALVAVFVMQADADASGAIALGSLFMVYEYARRAEGSAAALAGNFSMLAGQLSGWRALQPLLTAPSDVAAAPLKTQAWQRLELRDVTLAYEGREQPVLSGVNLVLRRGRRYAVTGASGAGKSALLALLSGLEPPAGGRLACDDAPVDAAWLRREATLVSSQPVVFEGSVRENLALGDDGDDAAMRSALDAVGLGALVGGLPQGLGSTLGDGSPRWSSGQQQRLTLARGTLAAAGGSLVLLDEPTSHLDKASAHAVMRELLAAHPDACVVVTLHDPELACHFDELIALADGRIVKPALAA